MNNKDQSQNGAVDNGIFTASPKTTEPNENETKSEPISSVKRYVPPHLRNRAINARENSNTNLEQPAAKGRERGPRMESQTQKNLEKRKNTESLSIHQPTHGAEKETNYELKPRDIRFEQEWFPSYERNDWNFSTISFSPSTSTIQVFGDDVPAPIQSLTDIDLGPVIMNNIALARYDTITPIQKHGMPIILSGRDLFTRAQTEHLLGSGKTYAYLFPIIAKLTRVNPNPTVIANKATPQCLIITPVRELSYSIHQEARKFVYRSHLKTCVVYGGAPVTDQVKELKRGCDILVATPGRLVDLVDRGVISLSNVKFLCLEEVDRMLDMGFEPQLRRIVEEHDMPGVGVRQTLLFSATFPKEVQRLAQELMYDYILLSGNPAYYSRSNLYNQQICFVDDNDKYNALVDTLVANEGIAMVYVSTKKRAEEVNNHLLNDGFPSTCIHGDRTQQQREEALTQFRQGIKLVLVATDVAARGLDINPATHVINYDMPTDIDSYVFRIGRTGHVARKGVSISFFSEENKSMAKDLVELLEQSDQEVPDWLKEYAAENHRDNSDRRRGRGVNVHSGRGGRGRGGSRGFGARARGRGYAENRFEPYGRGQSNTNNHQNVSNNEYSFSASNNNGNDDGGSQSSNGGSNTNWW